MSKKTKEKVIDPNDLPRNFNIVDIDIDENLEYGEYFNHSKYWTEKILKLSFFLLLASIILFTVGTIFFVLKPKPMVYGSQSDNTLYVLPTLTHKQAVEAVRSQPVPIAPDTTTASQSNTQGVK